MNRIKLLSTYFPYLVKWGYDVFGLIEKNLALKYEER